MRDERAVAEPATAPGHSGPGLRVRELGRTFPSCFPSTGSRSAERRTPSLQPTTAGQPASNPEHAWRTVTEDGVRRAECVRSGRHLSAAVRYRTRAGMALSARLMGSRKSGGASADGTARQRPRSFEWRIHPTRIRATDPLVPAGKCRFVGRSATRKPTSWQRRLTIRWRVTILRWTPDYPDTVVARVVLRRARVEPVVRREIAAGPTRSDRCAEGSPAGLLVAALTFRVTNATSSRRSEFAERRSFGGVRPASCRSVQRRSAADRRSPVRWRAVAA
ncbi:hypothetical protein NG2371_01062 [Nocardia gamkensis]|nr:hypothetical protein [Nocardia gamkensis]